MSESIYIKKLKSKEKRKVDSIKLKPNVLTSNVFTCDRGQYNTLNITSGSVPLYLGPDIQNENFSSICFFGNEGGFSSQIASGFAANTNDVGIANYKNMSFDLNNMSDYFITYVEDSRVKFISATVTFTLLRLIEPVDDMTIIFYLNSVDFFSETNGTPPGFSSGHIRDSDVNIKLDDINSTTKPGVYNDLSKKYTAKITYTNVSTYSPVPIVASVIGKDNKMRLTGYVDACVEYEYIS